MRSRLESSVAPEPLRDATQDAAEMPCTWSFFLVFHKETEQMHGDRLHRARQRGGEDGSTLLSSFHHRPRPASQFPHQLRPPQAPTKYSVRGVRRVARSPANSQAKQDGELVSANQEYRPIPNLRLNSVCEIYVYPPNITACHLMVENGHHCQTVNPDG
jgi:hypothetical protein